MAERPGRSGRGRTTGEGIGASTRWVVLRHLRAAGVRMRTGVACRRITRDGFLVAGPEGERLVRAGHVLPATGQRPD
ncbi:hypothetical protein, partial [Streptomyces albus]|uniref:hypothetical protein n=1 Tax=Streptomyces albus TaxID=1888 RepID=UPI0039EEA543